MQGEKQYKTGLDVGSTTAKIVIIDESGQTVFSRYERHNAQVNDLLSAYFREARQELGDIETSIAVTGSVGMGTAEQLRTEFIQEVVAATRYAQQLYPSASALIDIGGEDAKVVLFQGNHIDLHSGLTKSIRRLSAFARERLYSSCQREPSSRIRLCPMCHGRKSSFFIDIGKSHIPKHQYHNKKQPTSAIRFRNGL